MNNIPYANLTPDAILDAIENVGYLCTGSLLALNSYENRVYQVGIEEETPIIAKFYRPARWSKEAILEEHQFAMELSEQEIPVVPPLIQHGNTLHSYDYFHFALFPRKGGRAFELGNMEQLMWMGRLLGRLHAIGACQPFKHRLHINVENYGKHPYQFLIESFIPPHLKQQYNDIFIPLLDKLTTYFKEYKTPSIRLHGDCHAGNILWNDQGPHIVDLDDCLMGPAIQDIWMLLSGNTPEENNYQFNCILAGYEEFFDFNYQERHLIEPLRTLRMIHYSAWLAKRWQDPAFTLNFPWFNTENYWQEQINHLREQLSIL